MKKYFDKNNNRIVCIENKASSLFWDKHWSIDNFESKVKLKFCPFVTRNTSKYLAKGSRILEGGCGIGKNVYLLDYHDYKVIGVDYAQKTVDTVNKLFPDLDIRFGDVRSLEFPDRYFDGYWSFGVIEHFYDGYGSIMNEMYRVLKKDGYLFMTVPSLSLIRKYKIRNSTHKKKK